MSFSIRLADQSDIPTLADIGSEPVQRDAHTLLKQQYGYDHGATMAEVLQMWFARPAHRRRVVKAVDDESHAVLGRVGWGFQGHGDADADANITDAKAIADSGPATAPDTATQQAEDKMVNSPDDASNIREPSSSGIARLKALTDADLQHWMSVFMPPGTRFRCMYVLGLVVHPAHRSRGVGSALLRYETQQADRDRVFCWVHSADSDAAIGTFARASFREVGRLSLDLDEFAREERQKRALEGGGDSSGGAEYGVYTFRYMRREPVSTSNATNTDVQGAGLT